MVVAHGEKEDGEGGHLYFSLIILTCKCKKGVAVDFFFNLYLFSMDSLRAHAHITVHA